MREGKRKRIRSAFDPCTFIARCPIDPASNARGIGGVDGGEGEEGGDIGGEEGRGRMKAYLSPLTLLNPSPSINIAIVSGSREKVRLVLNARSSQSHTILLIPAAPQSTFDIPHLHSTLCLPNPILYPRNDITATPHSDPLSFPLLPVLIGEWVIGERGRKGGAYWERVSRDL